jgi:hypothetical protein
LRLAVLNLSLELKVVRIRRKDLPHENPSGQELPDRITKHHERVKQNGSFLAGVKEGMVLSVNLRSVPQSPGVVPAQESQSVSHLGEQIDFAPKPQFLGGISRAKLDPGFGLNTVTFVEIGDDLRGGFLLAGRENFTQLVLKRGVGGHLKFP